MNMNRVRRFASALLGAAMLSALSANIASAQEITVKHAQGELVLPETPKRVLVQDVAIVDILDSLGVEITGVSGDSHRYPSYLSKYKSNDYIKTGTLQEPNYEVIAGANADLMILASRSRQKYKDVARILPTIDLTPDNANFLTSVKNNISTLGNIFGKQERAAEMIATIDSKFEQLRAETAANNDTAIVLVTNAGKLGVYGPQSRVSWIFTEAGFKPVESRIDDRFHGGDSVSFEYLLEANPDWLFVIDRDAGIGRGGAAQKLLDNELMHQTNVWKNKQIVYLDPMDAYTVMHGYHSVINLADEVLNAIKTSR